MSVRFWFNHIALAVGITAVLGCQSAWIPGVSQKQTLTQLEVLPDESSPSDRSLDGGDLQVAKREFDRMLQVEALYIDEPEELPVPSEANESSLWSDPSPNPDAELQLAEVLVSVQQSYPLLESAMLERQVAEGKQLSVTGEFDLDVKAFGIAAPQGYYRTYRNGVSVDQPLYHGGRVHAGYKLGDGNFQPWYKERETDKGGEFSAGFGIPLLKDRTIDKRRAALFQADLARDAVEPSIELQLLDFSRAATQTYWSWVAAGQIVDAQRELLRNARARVEQIEARISAGDLATIARINNQQLIASRETKVIESERKLQQAAIKLSLFYRDMQGDPLVPDPSRLIDRFPAHSSPDNSQVDHDIDLAIGASPFIRELDIVAEQARVDLRSSENMLLPKLEAHVFASKDVGVPASSKRDKTPFELEAGLYGELPIQRREARGKVTSTYGKLSQLTAKRRFLEDKIAAAVKDAYSALQAASESIDRATANVRLARETLALGRVQFDAGDIDLVALNIYEQAATDSELQWIAAQAAYFFAVADYRAALSLDPLDGV